MTRWRPSSTRPPILLSRFIPLADATRPIEGVVDREPTTIDLGGKRFCVVMASNPYTTGGGRFEMPDMLVNRSAVFNLGDVSGENGEAFARSYIENSLTACPTIGPHAAKLLDDLGPVLQMAAGRKPVEASGLEYAWDGAELDAAVRAVSMLRRAQDALLKVNASYIASAATSEEETLTDEAEQNLLAYESLTGRMTEAEAARWREILDRATARAAAADGVGRVVGALDRLTGAVLHDPDDPGPIS